MAKRTYYSEDARRRAQTERSMIAAVSLALGVAIGTVIALLFAPEDGETIRSTIAETAEELGHKAEDQAQKLAS